MKSLRETSKRGFHLVIIFVVLCAQFTLCGRTAAQTLSSDDAVTHKDKRALRIERREVAGGAELLTIFGAAPQSVGENREVKAADDAAAEMPLVSLLRDTLGDGDPANDRLRDVWMHTYARPMVKQHIAAAVPFFYGRIGNRTKAPSGAPRALIDLGSADRDVWNRFLWTTLQSLVLNNRGFALKASSGTYRRNLTDYRKSQIIRALAALALYESQNKTAVSAFTPRESSEINARLMLAEKTFGGILDDINLQRVHAKQHTLWQGERARNWDLLRQAAENNDLYFEPLTLPDGTATHAMLWVAKEDLSGARTRPFDKRFLSIGNPWRDRSLTRWRGYTETWRLDADNRRITADSSDALIASNSNPLANIVSPDESVFDSATLTKASFPISPVLPATPKPAPSVTPVVRSVEMVPLALYGLEHPKVPALLVDFRDTGNAKRREMSRRVLGDVARNVLAVSTFGDMYFFLGRTVYEFVADRRGADINQPSRLRAHSQLQLLLSLDASLDPDLRDEIARRANRVSMNPLENDAQTEVRLAREQYQALIEYAGRDDGLARHITRRRSSEIAKLDDSRTQQTLYRLATIASLGLYDRPSVSMTPERMAQLDTARRLKHHTLFLREAVKSSPLVEVQWNAGEMRESLEFIAAHGTKANNATVNAVAALFTNTEDETLRELSLRCLYRINNTRAKTALLRIERDDKTPPRLREKSRELLRAASHEEQQFKEADRAHVRKLLVVAPGESGGSQ